MKMNDHGIILYDYLLVPGGAEKLILTLASALPYADLAVAYRDPVAFPVTVLPANTLYEWGIHARHPVWRLVRTWRSFIQRGGLVTEYPWALFSGVCAPAAIRHRRHGANIYYCHTPPRFVYDLKEYYLAQLSWYERPLLNTLIRYFKPRYEAAIRCMDLVIANSENVRRRLRRYLDLDALIIHPPVAVDAWHWLGQGDYYLSSARLEDFKRVDRIINAFKVMPDRKLIVVSGGTQRANLQELAGNALNIRFTGWLDEARLRQLTSNAIATLYIPMDEDFGMSPVESMAAGKPVIGVGEGGLLETVVDGETGILLPPDPVPEHIVEAVLRMTRPRALEMRAACEARARLFSREIFLEKMQAAIAGVG